MKETIQAEGIPVSPGRRRFIAGMGGTLALSGISAQARPARPVLAVTSPMSPPRWATQQRALIAMQTAAARTFHDRYFDAQHRIQAFLRWGANDGPDDAIEHVNDWPLLHLIGGDPEILQLYRAVQEAHFAQFSRVRTRDVPMGRKGMYYREFSPQMDWQHISEGLTTFNLMGLASPHDPRLIARTRRFADFYTGRDPIARNYDQRHRVIPSLFTGSLGPLMRPTTMLDWAGDPFDAAPFKLEHGENNYAQFLEHYREYTETVGDHPLNLQSTSLGFNAWLLTGEDRFRSWMLEYIDAWAERMTANGGIIPSNVGPDGVIGSSAGGRWWGGTYGWGFSPVVPQTGLREDRNRVPRAITAFMTAYLVTGDDHYLDLWRTQNARINEQAKIINGVMSAPTMYGSQGWYGYRPGLYRQNSLEIWINAMRASDRAAMGPSQWADFLDGKAPDWPEQALQRDIAKVERRLAEVAADTSTPATRLVDNAIDRNPVSVTALLRQTMGALHITHATDQTDTSLRQGGGLLYARLRHFDAARRQPGLPPHVAVLIEGMTKTSTTLTVVNCHPHEERQLLIRGGGYGEHTVQAVTMAGQRQVVGGSDLRINLAGGAGARLVLDMALTSRKPTLTFPDWV